MYCCTLRDLCGGWDPYPLALSVSLPFYPFTGNLTICTIRFVNYLNDFLYFRRENFSTFYHFCIRGAPTRLPCHLLPPDDDEPDGALRWRWALCVGSWWWRSSVLCRSSSSTSAAAPATPPRGAPSCLSLRSCPPPCWSTSALSYTPSPTSSTTGSSTSTPMLVVYTNIKNTSCFFSTSTQKSVPRSFLTIGSLDLTSHVVSWISTWINR